MRLLGMLLCVCVVCVLLAVCVVAWKTGRGGQRLLTGLLGLLATAFGWFVACVYFVWLLFET